MKTIPLINGLEALVDDADYELVCHLNWYCTKSGKGKKYWYARTTCCKHILMHRLILGLTDPKIKVDHENHNGLDNRRENIHVASNSFNGRNQGKPSRKTRLSSNYKGVYTGKWANIRRNKWLAQAVFMGKHCSIGYYPTEIEAAKAYDAKIIDIMGLEQALMGKCLNFPHEHRPIMLKSQ